MLREQNEMTQTDLGILLETSQAAISRIENINYSARNVRTLKKLARAFKVRLRISFETYGSLIDDVRRFNPATLGRAPRDKDPIIYGIDETRVRPEPKAANPGPLTTLGGIYWPVPKIASTATYSTGSVNQDDRGRPKATEQANGIDQNAELPYLKVANGR